MQTSLRIPFIALLSLLFAWGTISWANKAAPKAAKAPAKKAATKTVAIAKKAAPAKKAAVAKKATTTAVKKAAPAKKAATKAATKPKTMFTAAPKKTKLSFADGSKFGYALGYNFVTRLKMSLARGGIKVNDKALKQGVIDAIKGKGQMSQGEIRMVMMVLQQQFRKNMMAKRNKQQGANVAKGKAFLAANAKKPGVITLPSGLQYKVIRKGTGNTPKATDTVVTHYRGTLLNGQEFDSSYRRGKPATFPVNGVIKGWTQALQLMKEGGKWKLFIPSNLAYGARGAGPKIGPHSTLIFDIELLKVVKKK